MVEKVTHFIAHSDRVRCISASRNTKDIYLSGSDDGSVKLWHIHRPSCLGGAKLGTTTAVSCVQFNAKDTAFAAGLTSGSIQLFSLKSWNKIARLSGHRSICRAVAFHTLGNYFISGSDDTNVKLWSVKDKQCLKTFRGHGSSVLCLDYCPDGRWFASGSEDGTMILWDARMCKQLQEIKAHDAHIVDLRFHPEKQYISSVSADRTCRVWSLNRNCEQIFSTDKEKTKLRRACFVGKNNLDHLLTISEDCLKVWNWEEDVFVEKHECSSVAKLVRDVSFDPEEQLCHLYTSRGSTISIWKQNLLQHCDTSSSSTAVLRTNTKASLQHQGFVPSEQKETKSNRSPGLKPPMISKSCDGYMNTLNGPYETDSDFSDANEVDARVEASSKNLQNESKSDERKTSSIPESPKEKGMAADGEKDIKTGKMFPPPNAMDDHDAFMQTLKARIEQTKALSDLELPESVDYLLRARDVALVAQSLRESDVERKLGDIDSCAHLLPLLAFLLTSSVEEHLVVALSMIKFFLKSFAVTIKSTLEWNRKHSSVTTTVDLARDNRVHKCEKCWAGFKQLQQAIQLLEDGRVVAASASSTNQEATEQWSTATKRDLKYVTDRIDKFLND